MGIFLSYRHFQLVKGMDMDVDLDMDLCKDKEI